MSRKTSVQIGDIQAAGIARRLLPPVGKNRSVIVEFTCSICGKLGKCRAADFRSGRQKSCSCLEDKSFFDYHTRMARSVPYTQKAAIFEDSEIHGASAASVKFGIPVHTIRFVWVQEGKRILESMPSKVMRSIGKSYLESGLTVTANIFRLSPGVTLRIVRSARRIKKAAAAANLASAKAAAEAAERADWFWSQVSYSINSALSDLAGDEWWRRGEFTKRELPPRSRTVKGSYRWVLDALKDMPRDEIPQYIRSASDEFLSACHRTFTARNERRITFLRKRRAEMCRITM